MKLQPAMPSQMAPNASLPRPPSATCFALNVAALLAAAATLIAVALFGEQAPWTRRIPYRPALPCAVAMVVIVLGERRLLHRRSAAAVGAVGAEPGTTRSWSRIVYRLLGAAATAALLALAYWLLPEYQGSFYLPYWRLLRTLTPLAVLIPVYLIWVDGRVKDAEDECVHFGRLVCGRRNDADSGIVRRHLLGWLIKGYFLPLMSGYLDQDCQALLQALRAPGAAALLQFDFWFQVTYTIDLLFCVIGYTSASRLFDSQLRSVEPTLLGWIAALLCYQPFYSVIGQYYLHYDGSFYWDNWLAPWPWLQALWGGVIIALSMIYGLSTVAFGLRFSNLTHRGIVTGGPYCLTKHPAYLAKNLSWWLISVPFVPIAGVADSVRRCALLLALNGLYLLRARTEERHLSRDPVYVAYAQWIGANGLLRRIRHSRILLSVISAATAIRRRRTAAPRCCRPAQ